MRADFSELEFEHLTERELDVLQRIAVGSSDEDIAEELFLSINTVKWHNRNIYAKLGVESRTQALVVALQSGLLDQQRKENQQEKRLIRNNLPALISSFVGREVEINAIMEMLGSFRLLTLTGTAGVGKTRLALQVAARLISGDNFQDGVFFIELAPVGVPDAVGDALVAALNLVPAAKSDPAQILKSFLRRRKQLLILDNFEHLLPAAPLILDLLEAAPGVKVLITSREALGLTGEQVFYLDPLPLADHEKNPPASALEELDSVDLFYQRARAVSPNFSLVERNLSLVSEICSRLDGLPLALELAAARMNFFRPQELLVQLENRFEFLTIGSRESPDRHQTLEKAIDWSYQLLTDEEKLLFNRLSVFQGGRTFTAAEHICFQDLELDVLDGLRSLYAKNLIKQEEGLDGETRFTMLETLHAFARNRLEESEEAKRIKDHHAQFFTELAEDALSHIRGGAGKIHWLKLMRAEHANLRTAFNWSLDGGDAALGLRLVGSLDPYWELTGTGKELQGWVGYALEMGEDAPATVQAKIYSIAGSMYFYARQYDLSNQFYNQALKIFEELEDKKEIVWTISLLISLSEESQAIHPLTDDLYQRGVMLSLENDDLTGLTQLYMMYGKHQERKGNFDLAKELYQKAGDTAERNLDWMQVASSLLNMGGIAFWQGDPEASLQLLKESLQMENELEYLPEYTVGTLISIAYPCEALGRPHQAAKLLAAGCNHILEGSFDARPKTLEYVNLLKEKLREQLGSKVFDQAWAEGSAMAPEDSIEYALCLTED